jgi:hypothetical protein
MGNLNGRKSAAAFGRIERFREFVKRRCHKNKRPAAAHRLRAQFDATISPIPRRASHVKPERCKAVNDCERPGGGTQRSFDIR